MGGRKDAMIEVQQEWIEERQAETDRGTLRLAPYTLLLRNWSGGPKLPACPLPPPPPMLFMLSGHQILTTRLHNLIVGVLFFLSFQYFCSHSLLRFLFHLNVGVYGRWHNSPTGDQGHDGKWATSCVHTSRCLGHVLADRPGAKLPAHSKSHGKPKGQNLPTCSCSSAARPLNGCLSF